MKKLIYILIIFVMATGVIMVKPLVSEVKAIPGLEMICYDNFNVNMGTIIPGIPNSPSGARSCEELHVYWINAQSDHPLGDPGSCIVTSVPLTPDL